MADVEAGCNSRWKVNDVACIQKRTAEKAAAVAAAKRQAEAESERQRTLTPVREKLQREYIAMLEQKRHRIWTTYSD